MLPLLAPGPLLYKGPPIYGTCTSTHFFIHPGARHCPGLGCGDTQGAPCLWGSDTDSSHTACQWHSSTEARGTRGQGRAPGLTGADLQVRGGEPAGDRRTSSNPGLSLPSLHSSALNPHQKRWNPSCGAGRLVGEPHGTSADRAEPLAGTQWGSPWGRCCLLLRTGCCTRNVISHSCPNSIFSRKYFTLKCCFYIYCVTCWRAQNLIKM